MFNRCDGTPSISLILARGISYSKWSLYNSACFRLKVGMIFAIMDFISSCLSWVRTRASSVGILAAVTGASLRLRLSGSISSTELSVFSKVQPVLLWLHLPPLLSLLSSPSRRVLWPKRLWVIRSSPVKQTHETQLFSLATIYLWWFCQFR